MKTTTSARNAEHGVRNKNALFGPLRTPHSALRAGFTLVELLVVISIMAVLASLTLVVTGRIKKTEYVNVATAELNGIGNALEGFKAKYGVYPPSNANAPAVYAPGTSSQFPQLYYELSGVSSDGTTFTTLDGSTKIAIATVPNAFGVGGFINCSKGSGEEATPAKNFLLGLKANQIGSVTDNGVAIANLVTSVHGPDASYQPLGLTDVNPFRYQYPGSNNPTGYDLWVQLKISGKSYLVCNWTKSTIVNSPLP